MGLGGNMKYQIAAAMLLFVAATASAASTFVGQVDGRFEIQEGATRASGIVPVSVTVTTDYSSLDYELTWDFDITVAGGPEEQFETRLVANGRYFTSTSLNLSFPDSNGTTRSASTSLGWENEFSVIERIVTFEDQSDSGPLADDTFFNVAEFTVSDYPNSVSLKSSRSCCSFESLGELQTSTGETISLSMLFVSQTGGLSRAFDASLTELLPGDFNDSGKVGAEDYTVWRDVPGFLAPLLTDYDIWRGNYGAMLSSPTNSVPEPSGWLMVVSGLLSTLFVSHRKS